MVGDGNLLITGVAAVSDAKPGDIVLADDLKFLKKALTSECTSILLKRNGSLPETSKTIIAVENPAEAFIKILQHFAVPESSTKFGISPTAVIEDGVKLGKDISIGAGCFIGSGSVIGDGVIMHPNSTIGENAVIGNDSVIFSGVVVYSRCKIGKNARIHANAVIGADGFGYKFCGQQGLVKYPHIGIVEIGDDVEIGANSTIDRAKTGSTIIGSGTKIDNLVHIAHNVKIGKSCVIVALSGIAGSVEIGDGVTLAAQSGVKDHVVIGDGAVIAARAGALCDVSAGKIVSGFPAREHMHEKRSEAVRMHLPELLQRVRALEKELENLRNNK